VIRYENSFNDFVPEGHRVVRIVTDTHNADGIFLGQGVPAPLPGQLQRDFPQVERAARLYHYWNAQLVVLGARQTVTPRKFALSQGVYMTGPAFPQVFGYQWLSGSPAVLDEPNVAVLTRSLADTYFGNWQQAIGQSMRLDNRDVLLVRGILADVPPNTDFPVQMLISDKTSPDYRQWQTDWGGINSNMQCLARLREGVLPGQLQRRLPDFAHKYLGRDTKREFKVQPLADVHFNGQYGAFSDHQTDRRSLWMLALVGAFLLGMGCINFINLATVQALTRAKEVGVRKAVGSSRGQIAGQLLGETFLLVSVSVVAGLLLAELALPLVVRMTFLPPGDSLLNQRAMWLALPVLTVTVTLLAGFYPAVVLSGYHPIQALRSRVTGSRFQLGLRQSLVVTQFTVSQVLVVVVAVILYQMHYIRTADLGVKQDAVVLLTIPTDTSQQRVKHQLLKNELLRLPVVQAASASLSEPLSDDIWYSDFRLEGMTQNATFPVLSHWADADYLRTYGLELLAGRFLQASDTVKEVVVNQAFLRANGMTSPRQVIGKRIQVGGTGLVPVVGVVRDYNQFSLRQAIKPAVLCSYKWNYERVGVKLRTGNFEKALSDIQRVWATIYPEYIYQYQFWDESIGQFYESERKLTRLFGAFAAIAIFISCLGLLGLVSATLVKRTKEIGIRKVLGASVPGIVALLSKDFLKLVGIGFAITIPIAWYFSAQWLENFTYRVDVAWWHFALAGGLSVVIALLTIGYQSIKAAVANPTEALRSE
jgi:predicted permease